MHESLDLDLSRWAIYAVPFVGLAFGGLTLLVGRALLRKPHRPPPAKPEASQPDPFDFGSHTEKRSSLRRPGKPIKVFLSDAEAKAKPTPGWVIDRSMGGLGLSVRQAVAEHTILSVRTVDAPSSTPWVQIEIVRCENQGDSWELGCRFVRTPSFAVLMLFG
jgi:hypothetical protein